MSLVDGDMTPARKAQIGANIHLFRLFMQEYIEHPEMADEFPEKTYLVLLPDNDPALCDANLELARKKTLEGRTVVLRAVTVKP